MQYREGCEQALEGLVPSCARSEAAPHTESLAFPASIHHSLDLSKGFPIPHFDVVKKCNAPPPHAPML
jgi:hypothetical protein